MDLDRSILPDLKKNEKMQREIFQNARKLALYPENRETLSLCQFFVKKTTEGDSLRVKSEPTMIPKRRVTHQTV